MDRSELLPCPFCGAQPKQDHHACPNVWCDNEACTIVGVVFSGGPRHWNTRAAPPPPAEQASGYDAPVAATLADAAADPALTMDAARELLADTARAITAGAYAALSQRPVVDEARGLVTIWRDVARAPTTPAAGAKMLRACAEQLEAALAPQQPTGEEG